MSDMQENETRFQFRLPPADAQLALAIGAGLLGFCALQFYEGVSLSPLLLLIAMFVGGVWTKRAWLFYLLLGTLVSLKYFLVHPSVRSGLIRLQWSDVITALILLALAAACFRFLESNRFLSTFYPHEQFGEKPRSGINFEFPSLFGGRWWVIPLAVIVAFLLLGVIPFERPPSLRQFKIKPLASRLIFLTLFLFFAWFICRALVGTIVRWRMKPNQADVHCRSLIAKELWKDTLAIERRRAKQKADK